MSILRALTKAPATKLPVPLVGRRVSAFGSTATNAPGPLAQLSSVGTLFAVVDRCCTAVASVEWDLWNRPADGRVTGGDERTPAGKHAALDLWRQPNQHMTTGELVHGLTQYRKLVGEWFLVIVRAGSIPVEVWPVRPDRMTPVTDPTKFLVGWVYTSPDGEKVPLKAEDVIQSKMPNPLDPYRGLGPVQSILTELDSAKYTAEWNRNFFLNSAEPGGVIQLPVNLSDTQWEEFTDRWRTQHQGTQNAHRVAVIEYGGEYVPRGYSQRDMEFTALREASRDTIIEAFGISRATLGITDGVNFAAAKAADQQFAKLVTVPELRAIQSALNFRLLPQFYPGKRPSEIPVEFDYDSPVGTDSAEEAADRTSKVSAVTSLWQMAGVKFDLDALLEAYDLPVIPWEEVATPLPGQMFGPDGEVLPPPDPNAAVPGGAKGGATGADKAPKPAPGQGQGKGPAKTAPPAAPAKGPAKAPAKAEVSRETVHAEAPEWDSAQHDAAWRSALENLLARWESISAAQRTELGRQIAQAVDDGDLAALADLSVSSEDASILLREALVAVAATSAGYATAEAAAQGVTAVAAALAAEEVADVAAGTAGLLAQGLAVQAGREAVRRSGEGNSGEQVAEDVTAYLADQSDAPLQAALGGALHGTMNRARVATFAGAPVGSLYASEVLDSNTCGPCAAIDGRFVATTDDLSAYGRLYTAVGGYVDCLGGIRCRGTVTGVWRPDQRKQGT